MPVTYGLQTWGNFEKCSQMFTETSVSGPGLHEEIMHASDTTYNN